MFKKTFTAIATAAVITVGAMGAATSPAEAGVKIVIGHTYAHGLPFYFAGPGFYFDHYNPYSFRRCWRWKRKFHRTGRRRFLRKYRRCMRRHGW